jgi:hypothetical protein
MSDRNTDMRRFLGIWAVGLGLLGTMLCAAAIGLGWWAANWTIDRVTLVAARLDQGLSAADTRLEQVEGRLSAVRADLAERLGEAERMAADHVELPRLQSAIERLLDRLLPTIERAAALADSLRTVADGLRVVDDVVTGLGAHIEQPSRTDVVADAIDRAAETLNIPQARIDAVKSAAAVRLAREVVELAREAAAASQRLADGLVDVRRQVAVSRERLGVWRNWLVSRLRLAAGLHTVAWLWLGLGQLCLVSWGRRRLASPLRSAGSGATHAE